MSTQENVGKDKPQTASVDVTLLPPEGLCYVNIESPLKEDPLLSFKVKAGDQVIFPEEIEIDKHLGVKGPPGVYDIWITSEGTMSHHTYYIESDDDKIGKITNDNPTGIDHLARKKLVNLVATTILSLKKDETVKIGVFGAWGSGKTSFALALQERLQAHGSRFNFCWFNAWLNESTENVSASLTQDVIRSLKNTDSVSGYAKILRLFTLNIKYLFTYQPMRFSLVLSFAVLAIFVMVVNTTGHMGHDSLELKILSDFPIVISVVSILLFASNYLKIFNDPVTLNIIDKLKLPEFKNLMGSFPVMNNSIKEMLHISLRDNQKLVLFVDDLDRCKSDAINEILDATKLVVDNDKIVVILLCDESFIYSAIEENRNESLSIQGERNLVREYLSKLCDVSIRAQDMTPGMCWSYMIKSEVLAKGGIQKYNNEKSLDVTKIKALDKKKLAKLIGYSNYFEIKNPRQIKRMANSYKLLNTMYEIDDREISVVIHEREEMHYPLMYVTVLIESIYSFGQKADLVEIQELATREDGELLEQSELKFRRAFVLKKLQENFKYHNLLGIAKMLVMPPHW